DDLSADRVAAGEAPPLVVHWAGMKATLLRDMAGGDLLQFFEHEYYRYVPGGELRRRLALWLHVWSQWSSALGLRLKLRLARWFKPPRQAPRVVTQAIRT